MKKYSQTWALKIAVFFTAFMLGLAPVSAVTSYTVEGDAVPADTGTTDGSTGTYSLISAFYSTLVQPTGTRSCAIANGTGTQDYDNATSSWTTCTVASCDRGYVQSGNTCVATKGGSGGGGGGGSTSTTTPYSLPATESSSSITLENRQVDLPSSGIMTRPVVLVNTYAEMQSSFEEGTLVTDEDGNPYTGTLPAPTKLFSSQTPDDLPEGAHFVTGFTVNVDGEVYFDKPVEITLPMPEESIGDETIVVYYYNQSTGEYELIENFEISEDGLSIIIHVDHFSTFVVASFDESRVVPDTTEDGESAFTDIENHWAKDYINQLSAAGIVNGKTSTTFAPDDPITRAELVKIVVNAFEISKEDPTLAGFSDVSDQDWYATYVAAAKAAGVIGGYEDGTFRPNQAITRAEALKIMLGAYYANSDIDSCIVANIGTDESNVFFTDVAFIDWYASYVCYAKVNDIVGGYADGNFYPGNEITRAEVAKIIAKILAE